MAIVTLTYRCGHTCYNVNNKKKSYEWVSKDIPARICPSCISRSMPKG